MNISLQCPSPVSVSLAISVRVGLAVYNSPSLSNESKPCLEMKLAARQEQRHPLARYPFFLTEASPP